MSHLISGVTNNVASQLIKGASQQLQQNQTSGRTFESVLQKSGTRAHENLNAGRSTRPTQAPEAQIEPLRAELARGYERQAIGNSKLEPHRAELIDTRTRQELLRTILDGATREKRQGVQEFFAQVEKDYHVSDATLKELRMRKDLSQGELLIMQADIYKMAQRIEVMSKVVDQITSGIKAVLNTNI